MLKDRIIKNAFISVEGDLNIYNIDVEFALSLVSGDVIWISDEPMESLHEFFELESGLDLNKYKEGFLIVKRKLYLEEKALSVDCFYKKNLEE